MDSVFINIELYRAGNKYCAYVTEDGSSGYSIKGNSINHCADKVKEYIKEVFNRSNIPNDYEE